MQHNQTRHYLQDAEFQPLFVEELGWDYHTQALTVTVADTEYTLSAIAEKRGMVVFRCTATDGKPIPDYATRRAIQRQVATSVHEHVIIYTDAEETTQLWQWVRREPSKPDACREHRKSGMLNAYLYDVISVPSRLKTEIREWLSVEKRINRQSIYPDTIGFVDNNRQTRSLEFMFAAEQQLAKRNYKCVIENCGKSTNEQAHSYVYHIWGLAHLQFGETQEAIDKFERALTIDRWRYNASVKNDASGRGNDENGAWIATQTAKNIAEGKRGEYPTPGAILSLNHSLGKGMPLPSSGGMMIMPHILYTLPPYTLAYQLKRWYVLNLFYDYNELWDALPQLPEDAQQETQEYRREHEELANLRVFAMNSAGEKIECSHEDRNRECYLDPVFWDPEFYRPFRCDEIENPLKS